MLDGVGVDVEDDVHVLDGVRDAVRDAVREALAEMLAVADTEGVTPGDTDADAPTLTDPDAVLVDDGVWEGVFDAVGVDVGVAVLDGRTHSVPGAVGLPLQSIWIVKK